MQYEERFTIENQNFKDANIPHWGVMALSAHFLRGIIQMRAECVQGEGWGQKRPKNCVRTFCMAPLSDLHHYIKTGSDLGTTSNF